MNKQVLSKVRHNMGKNSPLILTGIGVTGVITTAIFAAKATPKALTILEHEERERGHQLDTKEKFLLTWKLYLPAAAMGTVTIACILGANKINSNRNKALIGLYALSEKALREYKDKVVEVIGENKEQKIRDSVVEDRLKANPVDGNEVIITGCGETLCYDSLSGRYFKSDIETIKRAVNKLGRDLLSEHFITLNDLYYELGLTNTKMGEMVGWHIDDEMLSAEFSSHLTADGTPCLVMDFSVEPRYGYND